MPPKKRPSRWAGICEFRVSGLGSKFSVQGVGPYYRGLNNYVYYFEGCLIMILVSQAPRPYSNYQDPYIKLSWFTVQGAGV